ncbi:hypothetical protein [Acidilobus sp. 7A]|uniref:hypothetical protein n=1 Tax=Acidilobus sp. 7A TaxID=1577685 RepID=UPI000764EC0B|nr:hypothetical protein [Acidilobus sp. 7A]AMD30709.1 hypothetical protein SE86_04635 [Acidilobus sp. 7A]
MRGSRRSVAEVVAVLILIIVAIAIAALIYAWLVGLIGRLHTTSGALHTRVEVLEANVTGAGPYRVGAAVENIGDVSASINYIAVEFASNASVICSYSPPAPISIPPGGVKDLSFSGCSPSQAPAPGTPVAVVVSTTDGVTATCTITWP